MFRDEIRSFTRNNAHNNGIGSDWIDFLRWLLLVKIRMLIFLAQCLSIRSIPCPRVHHPILVDANAIHTCMVYMITYKCVTHSDTQTHECVKIGTSKLLINNVDSACWINVPKKPRLWDPCYLWLGHNQSILHAFHIRAVAISLRWISTIPSSMGFLLCFSQFLSHPFILFRSEFQWIFCLLVFVFSFFHSVFISFSLLACVFCYEQIILNFMVMHAQCEIWIEKVNRMSQHWYCLSINSLHYLLIYIQLSTNCYWKIENSSSIGMSNDWNPI